MKIEVGMKCRQIKVIEQYGFNFVGMEFEITKVNDNIIMGRSNNIGFGIETNEFENYFELINEREIFTQEELEIIHNCLKAKYEELLIKIDGMMY